MLYRFHGPAESHLDLLLVVAAIRMKFVHAWNEWVARVKVVTNALVGLAYMEP